MKILIPEEHTLPMILENFQQPLKRKIMLHPCDNSIIFICTVERYEAGFKKGYYQDEFSTSKVNGSSRRGGNPGQDILLYFSKQKFLPKQKYRKSSLEKSKRPRPAYLQKKESPY